MWRKVTGSTLGQDAASAFKEEVTHISYYRNKWTLKGGKGSKAFKKSK